MSPSPLSGETSFGKELSPDPFKKTFITLALQ